MKYFLDGLLNILWNCRQSWETGLMSIESLERGATKSRMKTGVIL